MAHQPDPDAGPAGDPDQEPPASPTSAASSASPSSPASPDPSASGSADSSASGAADYPASPDSPASPGSLASAGSSDTPDLGSADAADSSAPSGPSDAPGVPGGPTGTDQAEREELLAGFASGGAWDTRPPGPELAAALAEAAGPQWRCRGASGEQLIGVLGRLAALESWAAAGKLGVIRALIRDDDPAFLGGSRHGDLPDVWDDALASEVALALAASVTSADKAMRSAWELGARLPEIGALLEAGVIDSSKARLVAEVFQELSDESAGRAEAMLVLELAEPPAKTYAQVERIATAIALLVDPHLGERRRKAAEKHRARVTLFRESAGTAGLSGRDLPTDQALAANASVGARASQYRDSGVFGKATMDQLRAAAYLDLLNRVPAEERIAHGLLTEQTPADNQADPDPQAGAGPVGGPRPGAGPRPGGDDCPCPECDGSCVPDDDSPDYDPDDDSGPDDDGPSESGPDDDRGPGGGNSGGGGPGNDGDSAPDGAEPPPRGPGSRPGDDQPKDGDSPGTARAPAPPSPRDPAGPRPVLQDLIFPLTTLLGLAGTPGEGHGLGPLDPGLCRTLAATAILSPRTTICLTVTGTHGIAIGHGCAKPGRPRPPAPAPAPGTAMPHGGPAPPLVALPARINLTITAGQLAKLAGQSRTGWALAPPGIPGTPGTRATTAPPGDPDWCRTWDLTLPDGRQLTTHIEPMPTYECDHRHESHCYQPNGKLRHLVQVRDHTCTFPPCNRHARDSDFEHAVPYDQGGRTCACNAGARSRQCHRVKQSPGWKVTQPRPGWHQWQTPRGRTYTQGPKRYPV
jgi:Domain of unknown function (DUF222)